MIKRVMSMCLALALLCSLFAGIPVKVAATSADGWRYEAGKWYYYKDDIKTTGWLLDGSTWYYLTDSGAMATGWICVNNVWYLMSSSGAWIG